MKSIFSLLFIGFVILFFSCKEEIPQPPISRIDIYNCHKEKEMDEIQTQNAIYGKWKLDYIHCFGSQGTYDVGDFEIEFENDNSLIIKIDNEIIHSTNWELTPFTPDGFAILILEETSSETQLLLGKIHICNEYLLFDGGSQDLCDTYYRKVN